MDSGSGSLQSSSGGDEEYDSRAESISAFLNNPSSTHLRPMPNAPQPPPQPPPPQQQHHHHHQTQTSSILFDPLSNYFDPLSSRSPPLNLDMVWSKTLRSDPNCTDLGNIMGSAPSSNHPFSQGQSRGAGATTFVGNSSPAMQFPPVPENAARGSAAAPSDHQTNNNSVRNSKKRSRASRRAPTTVLTTDTTNFRAMVQEFTGIPAPPFTSSSPFPRTRLDLFGTPSSIRSSPHLDSHPPPYLLRPFAQKIHPPPFISSSSSMADATTTTTSNNTSNSTSINLLPSDHLGLLLKQQPHQNLLNMQSNSPILTFQSLLQSNPPPPSRYPLANSALFGSKSHGSLEIPSNDPNLKMGIVDEFGLNHGHVSTHHLMSGLSNIISSDGPASRNTNTTTTTTTTTNNSPRSWAGGDGAGSNVDGGEHGLLRSLNGNYSHSQQRITNGKLNFSASSSDFHGDKGSTENVSTRSEGMVESWICSSD